MPHDVKTRMIGRALGMEREAEALIRKSEAAFTRTRRAHPEFEKLVPVIAKTLGR